MMQFWREFLDSLDTPGGHIVILLFLFYSGVFFYHYYDATGGGQIMNLSFGALSGYLMAKKSNKEQQGTSSTSVTETVTA